MSVAGEQMLFQALSLSPEDEISIITEDTKINISLDIAVFRQIKQTDSFYNTRDTVNLQLEENSFNKIMNERGLDLD